MTLTLPRAAFVAALLATASLAGAPALAADAPPAPKLTRDVQKNLADAQKADNAKDWPTALAALKKAQDVTGRTPYDDFVINQFLMQTDLGLNDEAGAANAAIAMGSYPAIPDEQKPSIYYNAMALAINTKQNDAAYKFAKLRAAALPPPDAKTQEIMVQAYVNGGDIPGANAMARKPIDAALAAGQRPSLDAINLLFRVQAVGKDEMGAQQTLELRAASYNDPDDWTKIVDAVLGTKGETDFDIIYLGRLLFVSGANVSPQDASIVGQTASHLTFFGDAVTAQEHGGTGFPDAKARAEADKKTIAVQIAAEPKQNGLYNVRLAETLYSYGMYAEAETAAKLAQSKGGTPDAAEAPMVLGMAQVAQGKFADGAATFATVTSGSPATPRIAKLWADFAKMKANPPAPATAAK
jgi:hypothetical protein